MIYATVGGQKIPIPHDVAGVMLTAKRRRGSHISPIDADAKEKKAS